MKIINSLLLAALTGLSLQVEAQQRFDLQQCIDYALENNQDLKNASLEIDISDAFIKETLSDGLPQINAVADVSHNYKVPVTIVDATLFDPNAEEGDLAAVPFATDYAGNATISLDQMIFDGSFFLGLKAAETYKQLSTKDHIKTKIDVIEAVYKAYYTVLLNYAEKELTEKNYNRLDTLLQETQIQYENGFAEEIDVNRVKVQYNNLRVQKNNIDASIKVSKMLLKFQMGMSQKEDFEVTESIEDMALIETDDIKAASEFSYNNRVEYSILQTNRELNNLDIKNNKVQYYPTLYLFGNYGVLTGRNTLSDIFNESWFGLGAVGLRLNWQLFDGFYKRNVIQQRKLKSRQIENQFTQLESDIDVQVQDGIANYERSVDDMEAQQENMQLAERVYNVTKIKYQQGVGANLDVIEADRDFKEAQVNYYRALYAALISKVELKKTFGILLEN